MNHENKRIIEFSLEEIVVFTLNENLFFILSTIVTMGELVYVGPLISIRHTFLSEDIIFASYCRIIIAMAAVVEWAVFSCQTFRSQ